jgi:hypothetical protein
MILAILGLAIAWLLFNILPITKDMIACGSLRRLLSWSRDWFCHPRGGVLDGTEVLAIFLSRKLSISNWDVIMVVKRF